MMQIPGNSADQTPVAVNQAPNLPFEDNKTPQQSSLAGVNGDADADTNVTAHYALLSKQFIRRHFLMRTVTWIFWMLTAGVAFAATTVWLLFPG